MATPVSAMAAAVPSSRGPSGSCWPAPDSALRAGQALMVQAAKGELPGQGRILLLPDKDADGLCAAAIVKQALSLINCSAEVFVHPLTKGQHVHQPEVIATIRQHSPSLLVVLDQGSRAGAILPGLPTLLIDHHRPEGFPDAAVVVSAYGHEPVATSSLLAYQLCQGLHPEVASTCAWMVVVGTVGDLGVEGLKQFSAQGSVPDFQAVLKQYGRKNITEAVSLINAARRSAACDVATAWHAIATASCPADLALGRSATAIKLRQYRRETQAEVDRCARAPPRFSDDSRIALIRISSSAQVHPVIAQRWTGRLRKNDKGGKLVMVMCANDGYLPGKVNFAARSAAGGGQMVDLIQLLKDAVADSGIDGLQEMLGADMARGHDQATGGIIPPEAFKLLLQALHFSEQGLAGGAGARKRQLSSTGTAEAGDGVVNIGRQQVGGQVATARGPKQAKLTAFFKQEAHG